MFTSECESEAAHGDCSVRCRELLNDTLKTQQGAAFFDCTCTDKDDKLCEHLKDVTLKSCMTNSRVTILPVENNLLKDVATVEVNTLITDRDFHADTGSVTVASQLLLIASFSTLLLF
ncbi:unnamed protein product [Litomosoides sigmodontis]|uniref:GDNF/GAS1 domain-containing protein n=1 Tax=Litomosoides sigmodontis TaxID=42156 RepID=A0A3P6SD46_LITSI|nr:unnamed protein product [Litomosoides sigmodontis]